MIAASIFVGMQSTIVRSSLLGILSTLFLSTGLIVNSLNTFHGAHWAWTASLRFLLLLPVLTALLLLRGKLGPLLSTLRRMPGTFLLWGNLCFGGYYALLSYAIRLAPGWLVTAGFMTTVLAGLLLSPFIYRDHRAVISKKALLLSVLLVVCLFTLQLGRIEGVALSHMGLGIALSLVAAFLWPLGNRKLLLALENEHVQLDPMQRVLGMTIGSLPMLIALSVWGYLSSGAPTTMQLESSFVAVLFSGVLGGVLFYKAMQMAGQNKMALLTVEATQIFGVLFTLLGEMLFKGVPWPGLYATIGFSAMFGVLIIYMVLASRPAKNSVW